MTYKNFLSAALFLFCIIGLSSALWADSATSCSNASLTGRYGFTFNGINNGNSVSGVGQIATNGNGTLAGYETIASNGAVGSLLSLLGTYQINSDCTGTMTIQPAGLLSQNFAVTVFSSSTKIEMIQSDAGTTVSGSAQAQPTVNCPENAFNGPFGLQGAGLKIGSGPLAMSGLLNLHNDGTLDGTETTSVNGVITSGHSVSGAYKIINNCSGAAVLGIDHGRSLHLNLEVVDNGREILFIQIDSGTLFSGSLTQ